MATYKNTNISIVSLYLNELKSNEKNQYVLLFALALIIVSICFYYFPFLGLPFYIILVLFYVVIQSLQEEINYNLSRTIKSLELNNQWLITYNLWDKEIESIRTKDIKEIIINQYYLPNLITLKIEEKTTTDTIKKELDIDFMDAQVWIDLAKVHQIKLAKIYEYSEEKSSSNKVNTKSVVLASKEGIKLNDWIDFVKRHSNIWQWQPNKYYSYPIQPNQLPVVNNFKWMPSLNDQPILIQHYKNKLVLFNVPTDQFNFIKDITDTFNLKIYYTNSQPIALIS